MSIEIILGKKKPDRKSGKYKFDFLIILKWITSVKLFFVSVCYDYIVFYEKYNLV